MSTHFFGLNQRAYEYSHTAGKGALNGNGFNNPVDMAISDGDVAYVLSRSYMPEPAGGCGPSWPA